MTSRPTITTYNLRAFAGDLDAITAQAGADYHRLVLTAKPLLEKLLADMSWLSARYYEPAEAGQVHYLLWRHPADAYTIASVVFPALFSTPVHDHGTWGLVGVWQGQEYEERFKRLERSTNLRVAGSATNTPGSVSYLIPPDQDIHRIQNLASQPACSIHIYGRDFRRRQYDLQSGAVRDWPRDELKVID